MGSVCCCFHVPDSADNDVSNTQSNEHNVCPKCSIPKFCNMIRNLFARGANVVPVPNQHAASLNSEVASDYSSATSRSLSGAAKSSSGSRHLQEDEHDASIGRKEKGTSRSQVRPEPVVPSIVPSPEDADDCPICLEGKNFLSQLCLGSILLQDCSEYTPQNPKIITKCFHHYHLGCIYDWLERSENCPFCAKLMLFDEIS